jgi:amidase
MSASAQRSSRLPAPGEDPLGAVVRFCDVQESTSGPLAGRRVCVKDTIAVANIPMRSGPHGREVGPREDAIVVERLLSAGARIVAKTTVGDAPSLTHGQVRNPLDPRFAPGGSSSGSAVAVAAGLADFAVGADQGGSIRVPAAWCGLVGMKPTHGLVPTYGLLYWDHTLDHIGPITTSVADNAMLLEVMAGPDWRDPQARLETPPVAYADSARLGVEGLRIGAITESRDACDASARATFARAESLLEALGAEVVPVSLPLWSVAVPVWWAIVAMGLSEIFDSLGQGATHAGRVDPRLLAAENGRHVLATEEVLDPGGAALLLAVEHLRTVSSGLPLATAQNLRVDLTRQVERALHGVDVLITPTTPGGPPRLDAHDLDPDDADSRLRQLSPLANCCPLNLTGHPALSIPCGRDSNGLPAGLQIIGRRLNEATAYRVAFAIEASTQTCDTRL